VKRSRNKKKRRVVPVPIASMGDIAFLLIIFFMVCSEVTKEKKLNVTLPVSEHVEKNKDSLVARIAVDEAGQIFFDGRPVDSAKDVEWGVRAMLANTVSEDQRHVQFKCDAALPKETFEPVLKAIAEAGGIIEAVGELAE
jgi:biopolymer transport protein ExbD